MKENIEDKYIHDNGFGKRVYFCDHCRNHTMIQFVDEGVVGYFCEECGSITQNPEWATIFEDVAKRADGNGFAAQNALVVELFGGHILN